MFIHMTYFGKSKATLAKDYGMKRFLELKKRTNGRHNELGEVCDWRWREKSLTYALGFVHMMLC